MTSIRPLVSKVKECLIMEIHDIFITTFYTKHSGKILSSIRTPRESCSHDSSDCDDTNISDL